MKNMNSLDKNLRSQDEANETVMIMRSLYD